jgi:hypothetical protein
VWDNVKLMCKNILNWLTGCCIQLPGTSDLKMEPTNRTSILVVKALYWMIAKQPADCLYLNQIRLAKLTIEDVNNYSNTCLK